MKHKINVEIGLRLKDRRRRELMTQKVLADKLGISCQQVQKYEKGVDSIPAFRLVKCMDALKVDANYFFCGLE